jgi:hypothetical protein
MLPVNFRNGSANYSYNVPVYVTNSGGWQYVTFTVPPPPNGSAWTSDNTAGIYIGIAAVNINAALATPNTWQNANYMGVPGYNPWWSLAGNYIELTGVQLERGTVATPFEVRNYAQELALCQRYFLVLGDGIGSGNFGIGPAFSTTQVSVMLQSQPVPMRVSPSSIGTLGTSVVQLYNSSVYNVTAFALSGESTNSAIAYYATIGTASLVGGGFWKVIGSGAAKMFFNAEL